MKLHLLAVLGLLAATPAHAELRATLPSLTSPPITDDDLWRIWPAAARSVGLEASVSMTCVVTVAGLAEKCSATTATRGSGFEAAVLAMAPNMRFKPAAIDGSPTAVATPMRFDFSCSGRCKGFATPGAPPRPIVLYPSWVKTPDANEIEALYPPEAARNRAEGTATLLCQRLDSGLLEACAVTEEAPAAQGFGDAALKLAPSFRGPVAKATLEIPLMVRVRIGFKRGGLSFASTLAPGESPPPASPTTVRRGNVIYETNPMRFFPEVAMRRETGGVVQVICKGHPEKAFTGCVAASERPTGFGFAQAGERAGEAFRLAPRMVDGHEFYDDYQVREIFFALGR